ncbi:MAG: hypothetical protein IKC94_02620 [Lentisphaeria bacterium]|nr:hypothetical protein [Lentisphaeria bacterium]
MIENSHRQKMPMMSAYMAGDNDFVHAELADQLEEPGFFTASTVNTGDELHWQLEAGSFAFHSGNFEAALAHLTRAENLIADYDDRARISLRDAGANAGMLITNLNALPYRGFCRDRMMLQIYKSLVYLALNREDAFRAQLRRLRNAQKQIQDDYREFFDSEQAALEAARQNNPQAAATAGQGSSAEKLAAGNRNEKFSAALKATGKAAHRGYGNFLNPAALFLSALGSIRDGNFDNARIDLQRVYEAMPDNPLTQTYLATILDSTGRERPAALQKVKAFDFPLDHDCVYVLFANGRSAAFQQISLNFPVMAAWPVCEFYPAQFEKLLISAGNRQYQTGILADMDGIIAREFEERMPLMITRIVLSTAIKEAAKYAAAYAAYQENEVAGALVLAGASLYTAAVNTADTRSWEILPKELQLTQFPMPADRQITIAFDNRSAGQFPLTLPEKCRSAIIFVSAPSPQNVAIHLLPLTSK